MSEQTNPIRDAIAEAISENDVILFMKGTPDGPACGFSARAVAALQAVGTPFAAVDILPDPRIRQELSALSGWPTIPQLFVGGELVGGSDIIIEMYESGELAEAVGAEHAEGAEEPAPLEPQQAQPAPPMSAARPASPASRPLPIENRLN
jgi:monothiol glutaredoxin